MPPSSTSAFVPAVASGCDYDEESGLVDSRMSYSRMGGGDITSDDRPSSPGKASRNSDGGLILAVEQPNLVREMIQKAVTSEWEVTYRMTGETGSCMYMSPEVHRCEPYNEKTDVYSFGVMLFEVFSRTMMVTLTVNPGGRAHGSGLGTIISLYLTMYISYIFTPVRGWILGWTSTL